MTLSMFRSTYGAQLTVLLWREIRGENVRSFVPTKETDNTHKKLIVTYWTTLVIFFL